MQGEIGMSDDPLFEELKDAFRRFEISQEGVDCKSNGWYPQAGSLAEIALQVVRKRAVAERSFTRVIDLRHSAYVEGYAVPVIDSEKEA
jgi:hypothetical protein